MTSYIICRKRLGIKKSDIELLKKSLEDRKFEHFKSELLKILDKKEKEEEGEEVSKAFFVQDLYKSMTAPLYMAKAGFPVGTIREWKGKKYKKLSEKKWVRVYDKETRGAKLAIAALRRKIDACKTSQDLLDLVLQNKERFSDEQGRPLPIIQELSKYVSSRNDSIEKPAEPTKEKETSSNKNADNNAEQKNDAPAQYDTKGSIKNLFGSDELYTKTVDSLRDFAQQFVDDGQAKNVKDALSLMLTYMNSTDSYRFEISDFINKNVKIDQGNTRYKFSRAGVAYPSINLTAAVVSMLQNKGENGFGANPYEYIISDMLENADGVNETVKKSFALRVNELKKSFFIAWGLRWSKFL